MLRVCLLLSAALLAVGLVPNAWAVEIDPHDTVIGAATAKTGLRFSAVSDVVRLRVQALTPSGALVYDSGWQSGNLFDWPMRDAFDHPLAYGSYDLTISAADLDGHIVLSHAVLHWNGEIALESNTPRDTTLSLMRLVHDGSNGAVVTTTGDLSFRFGNFLAADDVEVMRLTRAGDLTIGGLIRPQQGILFPDGTVQRTAASAYPSLAHLLLDKRDWKAATDAPSGTPNCIARWTSTPGLLGDSIIWESSGKIGIGTATPLATLHVYGPATNDVFAGLGPNPVGGPAMNYGYSGNSFGRASGFFNVRPDAAAVSPNPSLRFMTNNQQRMIISDNGNVGIGTGFLPGAGPVEKLDVGGNINVSGSITAATTILAMGDMGAGGNLVTSNGRVDSHLGYTIDKNMILTIKDDSTLVGRFAGQSLTSGTSNTFVGYGAGKSETTGFMNTFVGHNAGSRANGLSYNTYVGMLAGYSALGATGGSNTAFGAMSGFALDGGFQNTFCGESSGYHTESGSQNVFVGSQAGTANTSGTFNTFVGSSTGTHITTESANTLIGTFADAAAGVSNGTAIGMQSYVAQSASVILGSISGVNGAGSNSKVGIGTTTPAASLQVASGDVYVSTAAKGIILKSPNGLTCARITIANTTGVLVSTVIPCP